MNRNFRLGIYGGSFSPPHMGHLLSAEMFFKVAKLDKLIVMPAFSAPNKNGISSASPIHRYEMAKIAFSHADCECEVSDFEMNCGGVSYTINTLKHFASDCDAMCFLCGSDMFVTLDSWRCFEEIFALTEIVCMRRENDCDTAKKINVAAKKYAETFGARVTVVSENENDIDNLSFENGGYVKSVCGKIYDVSSSSLRKSYAEKKDNAPEGMLDSVKEYIRFFGLYKPRNVEISEDMILTLKSEISTRMTAKRFEHTLGVEKTAAWLGEIFLPDDVMKLRAAALLHDVTKELSFEKQLQILAECDTISGSCKKLSQTEAKNEFGPSPLWHSITASKRIPIEFPLFCDDEILNAVRWHTTGRASMTAAELIICLSDFIEPSRKFENCINLRNKLEIGLNEAETFKDKLAVLLNITAEMFEMTMDVLHRDGRDIAPESIEALEYVQAEYAKIFN